MPRQTRLDIPGAPHHIMIRVINKADIFIDDQERGIFLQRLARNISEAKCSMYAWTLMSNHILCDAPHNKWLGMNTHAQQAVLVSGKSFTSR